MCIKAICGYLKNDNNRNRVYKHKISVGKKGYLIYVKNIEKKKKREQRCMNGNIYKKRKQTYNHSSKNSSDFVFVLICLSFDNFK